jgi:5'-3' exonuclease
MSLRPQFFDVPTNSTQESLQGHGTSFAELQRGINWWIGDLARYAEARWPDTWHQVFPEWISPGLVDRCKAVAKAYPNEEDRNPDCTYTQHMQLANKPDRKKLLEEVARNGLTSDESRKTTQEASEAGTDEPPVARWLLAVDVNYHLHRHWFSGAGVEAATRVSEWIQRTVERLTEKGLTDVACCFDSQRNFRKELTAEWEAKYKDRPPKDPELVQQLQLVGELLTQAGFRCVTVDGFESDDVLASYAAQFDGRVTILTQDKDLKQALSESCNMLLDVEWEEDQTSGDMLPTYKWLSAKQHTETTGLRPDQWPDYQAIWGDTVDGIKGAPGIGEKGAKDLILEFGTVDAVIQAAREEDERIKPKKREALLQLAGQLDTVRQLVTMRTDVRVPMDTRI